MFPELFRSSQITIHSYGLLIVIGFLLCVYFIRDKSRKAGLNVEHMTDLSFWALFFGLIGGRVLYVATQWHAFASRPLEMLRFWNGGLVFYGGFIGGTLAFIYFTRKYKIPTLQALDIAMPSVAIAHAFGRLGCFASGCCYGRPLDSSHPFAVVFNHAKTIAPKGIHMHPAQLYDAGNAFIIFLIVSWIYKRKKFHGQVLIAYAMLYAVGRSIVETYRGDKVRGFVIEGILSTSQFIALLMFLAGIGLYWRLRNNSKPEC